MVTTAQRRVASFVADHGLEAPSAYRLLDALAEVGEIAADLNESTDYGSRPAVTTCPPTR